jgi:magnesium chelatase family protein
VSLAHRGVLFLDELPEFRRDVLEAIRQPLEDRRVCVVRAAGAAAFPSDFLLVAAMNPCPCGYFGDPRRACTCDPRERRRYARRISGPLLDRIDLYVAVEPVAWRDLAGASPSESSAAVRERVRRARARAALRRPDVAGFRNADLAAEDLARHGALDHAGRRVLEIALERLGLSVRAVHRGLRVARTIADLAESERVLASHLSEALAFRAPAPLASCPTVQVDSRGGRP